MEQKAGQNRLSYLVCAWKFSYVPLGHENVLRALCLSVIGSHPSPLAQSGQCFLCSIRRLETPFRVLFSTRILVKSLKTMHSMICENWDPFKKNEREAMIKIMGLKRLGDAIRTISYQKFVFSMHLCFSAIIFRKPRVYKASGDYTRYNQDWRN